MRLRFQSTRRGAIFFGASSVLAQVASGRQTAEPYIRGVGTSERKRITEIGEAFRQKYGLPGVSLAMSFRGRLKLLACFGYANTEARTTVRPEHQFRIASVSKPITAVAILRLVQAGKLQLSERVFSANGHLARYATHVADGKQAERLKLVKLRHLLEHTSGGWSNQGGEAPMFAKEALGLKHADLIRWTLSNRMLKTEPGLKYAYSNFGYCLLGRVIESVTGKSYEEAVQQLVLSRVKANDTFIGAHKRENRRTNEVVYYDKYDPYGDSMDVARMDAHGGWISTPSDLVRFAQHIDGFANPKDILSARTIRAMTTPSMGNYALGWNVNQSNNWWHGGSFNGGSSILARIHDGHCWAVVVNTRSYESDYSSALDQFPWQIKGCVKRWGTQNLFAT